MRTLIAFALSIVTLSISAQTYTLNVQKSKLEWTGYGEIGNFKQEGTITAKEGVLLETRDSIQSADVIIDMTKITHEDRGLTKHLKNDDFFYIKKYPEAYLKMKSMQGDTVIADLTIRDITHPVIFKVEIMKGEEGLRAKGKMIIDRTLYNIKYNSSSYFQDLGNYAIKNEFELKFELIFE